MEILSNDWIIRIVTGIISGVLVTLITRFIISKRGKKEYLQSVVIANNEIIYSIAPLIAEQVLPSQEILDSIFISTARKHGVDLKELYNINTLSDDLIKEIMANHFLSSHQKLEYCNSANTLRNKYEAAQSKELEKLRETALRSSETIDFVSNTIGITAGVMATFAVIYTTYLNEKFNMLSYNIPNFLLLVVIIILVLPLFSLTIAVIIRKFKKSSKPYLKERTVMEENQRVKGSQETTSSFKVDLKEKNENDSKNQKEAVNDSK